MIITKKAKKIMATMMAAALLVTSFAITPKEVKAAAIAGPETISEAKASIRESGDALRFLVTATLPKTYTGDLGIELKIGDKTKKVSLHEGNTKLYSAKESGENLVVGYTVAITGIPGTAAETEITATGFADDKTANPVVRTVKQVANAAGYTFDENGFSEMEEGTKFTKGRWNLGTIPIPDSKKLSDYSGKSVELKMDVRMEGKIADSNDTLQLSFEKSTNSYSNFGNKIAFTNEWKTITIKVILPEISNENANLYFSNYNIEWITEDNDVNIYYKNLSFKDVTVEPVTYTVNKTIKKSDSNKKCSYDAAIDITKYAFILIKYRVYRDEGATDCIKNPCEEAKKASEAGSAEYTNIQIGSSDSGLEYMANVGAGWNEKSIIADDGTITTTLSIPVNPYTDGFNVDIASRSENEYNIKAVVIDSITLK